MARVIAWAQLATAIAALATAILVGCQVNVYQKQLAEMHAQGQQIAAQTFVSEAATLARIFPAVAPKNTYREALQTAQKFTFDVVAADALEPRPTPTTPLVNIGAIHELSREADERLVEQLLAAAQRFHAEKAASCVYSPDALQNIQREFMATYLLVHPTPRNGLDHPATSKDLYCEWRAEKRKHLTGRQSPHSEAFRQFAALVEQITVPCGAQVAFTHS